MRPHLVATTSIVTRMSANSASRSVRRPRINAVCEWPVGCAMLIAAHPVNLLDELPVDALDLRAAKRLCGCIGGVALYGGPFRTDPLA